LARSLFGGKRKSIEGGGACRARNRICYVAFFHGGIYELYNFKSHAIEGPKSLNGLQFHRGDHVK
jgi:hypothetical protein